MSSKKLFATLLTLVAIAGATFVYGQGPTPGMDGHIHDSHPTTSHGSGSGGGGWVRTSLLSTPANPVPVVTALPPTKKMILDLQIPNMNCSDYGEGAYTYMAMTEHTVHVTVGGSYQWSGSVEAGGNILAAQCKAVASSQATISAEGGWRGTFVETKTIKSPKVLACQTVRLQYEKEEVKSTGSLVTYDHKIICQKGSSTATSYCNKVNLSGGATGWSSYELLTPTNLGLDANCVAACAMMNNPPLPPTSPPSTAPPTTPPPTTTPPSTPPPATTPPPSTPDPSTMPDPTTTMPPA